MAIYLVQHGKCLSKDEDPAKGLSDAGISDVERIAGVAAGYGVEVTQILHSGKKRARQTAELMGKAFSPPKGVRAVEGIAPLDDAAAFAHGLDLSSGCMVVGHLPFLEKLTAFLVTGQLDKPVFQLQNGGIICLGHYEGADQVVIKWALMPTVK